jgi:hypothetical protein
MRKPLAWDRRTSPALGVIEQRSRGRGTLLRPGRAFHEDATPTPSDPVNLVFLHADLRAKYQRTYIEVTERASQTLLDQPVQFKAWSFGAGQHDTFWEEISFGLP